MPQPKTTPKPAAADNAADLVAGDWTPKGAPAKLAFIQTHITNVEKTGRNTHHNYDYFQEHGLLDLIRPLLRELRCAIVPSPTGTRYERVDGNRAIVSGYIDFIDTEESPFINDAGGMVLLCEGKPVENPSYRIRAYFTNEGTDNQDKATNKALTGWMKYALQKLFAIPTEKVDDADHPEVQQAAQRTQAPGKVAEQTAVAIVKTATEAVKAGHLDGNKFKAKLATYRTDAVTDLTPDQAKELSDWMIAQIEASSAQAQSAEATGA